MFCLINADIYQLFGEIICQIMMLDMLAYIIEKHSFHVHIALSFAVKCLNNGASSMICNPPISALFLNTSMTTSAT